MTSRVIALRSLSTDDGSVRTCEPLEKTMNDITTLIDTHLAGYCEPDGDERVRLLASAWSADGVLIDPPFDGTGPDGIAAMVYVDSAPGKGALDPGFEGVEKPLVWADIEQEENLDGLTEEQRATFRARAVPVPGGVLREAIELTNEARRDIPSTIICTGWPSEQLKAAVRDHDWAWLRGVSELRDLTWVDLPTSHWPMWSRPDELASIIGDVADAHAPGATPRGPASPGG